MLAGLRYINNDIFYTIFKPHFCPKCGTKLMRVKKSKIVNSNDLEAKEYDFSSGEGFLVGDVKFVWKEFKCRTCGMEISVEQMRGIEKMDRPNLRTKNVITAEESPLPKKD